VSRFRKVTGYLAPLLRLGLVVGVISAVAAFPLIGLAGLGALQATHFVDNLPAELRTTPAAQVTYVFASDGTPITQFYEEYRHYVPLTEISPYMRKAIVASEDARYYDHHGVDTRGVLRAFVANQGSGGVSQGASTLTMQYVRDVQRDSAQTPEEVAAATDQTAVRKLTEMRMAVQLEKELTKDQILERYLNEAYFGHRAYGIYAAAEVFFSKTPAELSMDEAATLAGLVKAPTSFDPAGPNQAAALARRNYVVDRMADLQYITAATAATLKRQPITLHLTDPPNDCISVPSDHNDWGFFCDMLKNWWIRQPAFGPDVETRLENLRRGGYRIVTTLNPRLQAIATQQVDNQQSIHSSYALGLVAVQPGTGAIQAAAVNRRYSLNTSDNGRNSDPNLARQGQPGSYPNTVAPLLGMGDEPGYQAGSTFKIFTMTAALEAGLPLDTKIMSPMVLRTNYLDGPGDSSACGNYWCPHNASAAMTGVQDMRTGFGKSVNTYFVQLEERIGAERAVAMAEQMGLTWHTDVDAQMASPAHAHGWGSFTLGVADTTPLEMAGAYATIAADGRFCPPTPVLSVVDQSGKRLPISDPQCRQIVAPDVARAALDATRCTTGYNAASGGCGGWSTAPGVYGAVGRPVGGKTGTTDSTEAAWFVGVTPDLAIASFIADPDTPFDAPGDALSQAPVNAVAYTLRLGLQPLPVRNFIPPTGPLVGSSPVARG
jgi:membrane peptidoglycan carboxypeptidase